MNEKAKKIIENNLYMTISTADKSGKPWISPVFFAHDSSCNLFWVSNKNALHSKNISHRPEVAIVVFDSTLKEGDGDAVYFDAVVSELNETSEIEMAMKCLNNKVTIDSFRVSSTKDVTGGAPWRIYKARPIKVSKLGPGTEIDGYYVDKREVVDIRFNNGY